MGSIHSSRNMRHAGAVLIFAIAGCAGPGGDVEVVESTPQPEPSPIVSGPYPLPGSAIRGAQPRFLASDAAYAPHSGHYPLPWLPSPVDRERYTRFDDNPVRLTASDPVSTFSIDVDTASYSRMRRALGLGQLPHVDSVRTEELINYFNYDYAPPQDPERPFAVHLEVGPSPWHAERRLLKIGLKGYERAHAELPPANLVFLIDVSGSMRGPDRLDLLKTALGLLMRQMRAEDRVSIAVYAGAAGVVLEPTPGNQHAKVLAALDALEAGGSTNGGAGIALAYNLARQAFKDDGINRVILATDGDFNVGTMDTRVLEQLVERERGSGIGLTVLGFGMGNYHDALMQSLAQKGNGQAAYIDNLNEARKVLVDQLAGTLETIAHDVKIQVEFNPALVAEYRLIGYETRHLEREDFNNDAVDAGDIGAGHTVTALYEITPAGSAARLIDPLRFQASSTTPSRVAAAHDDEIAFVRLRYKRPGEQESRLIERAVLGADAFARLEDASADFRFAAAVAGFGQLLRGGPSGGRYTGALDYADVVRLARAACGDDAFGYRGEFINLATTAAALARRTGG
jgi:Ca-activated chloride channel homolog